MPLSNAPQAACYPGGTPGCLAPGTYRLTSSTWPAQVTVDVPAGWFQWLPASDFEGVLVDSGPDAPNGSGWGLMFFAVGAVSADPCDPAKGTIKPAQTSTVDGLVAVMTKWPGFKATAPTPITVDGFSGKLIELTSTLTTATCPSPVLWTTPQGYDLDAYPVVTADKTPHTGRYRIVDVNGTLLVIRTTDFPETAPNEAAQGVALDPTRHASDQVELHQMVDSIRINAPR